VTVKTFAKEMLFFQVFNSSKNPQNCKKYFQDLLSQHIFFCQINFIIIYLVDLTKIKFKLI